MIIAVLSVILNLFVAVERPFGSERIVLDILVIMLIATIASALMRSRRERKPVPGAQPAHDRV
jgi:hypothetical protein